MKAVSLLLACLALGGCQTTISNAQLLAERSGTGTATLPPFTAKGHYDVDYSFDHCGATSGMVIIAHVRGVATPDTLLRSEAVAYSGSVTGDRAGIVSLEIQTTCKWTVTVKG